VTAKKSKNMPKWEYQILEILARKQVGDFEEFKEKLRRAGRLAPCRYIALESIGSLTATCFQGKELSCLTCSEYEPEEEPAHWNHGYAVFGSGRVIHLLNDVESNGYWRSGLTLCGRILNEENDDVEIYPLDSFEDIFNELNLKKSGPGICNKCQKNISQKRPLL
jgi:hypothetical protein